MFQAPGQWGWFKDGEGVRLDQETESWGFRRTFSFSEPATPLPVEVVSHVDDVSLRMSGEPLWRDPSGMKACQESSPDDFVRALGSLAIA